MTLRRPKYNNISQPSNSVGTSQIEDATVALADMADLASGKIILGSSGNRPAAVTPSGDITMTNAGVTTVGSNKISYSKLDAKGRTYKLQMRHAVAEASATTDFEKSVGECPAAGTVTSVKFIPDAGFGQATNYATLSVINKGAAGSGSTVVATKAYSTAVSAYVASALTLGTGSDIVVAAGDILTVAKTHTSSGQLVPVGEVQVTVERSE